MRNVSYRRSCTTGNGGLSFDGFVFIHLPLGFSPVWSSSVVENHGPFHTNHTIVGRVDIIRRPGGFPVPICCESPRSPPSGFTLLSRDEEEPLLRVSITQHSRKLWLIPTTKTIIIMRSTRG
jgi:hypothetical protein